MTQQPRRRTLTALLTCAFAIAATPAFANANEDGHGDGHGHGPHGATTYLALGDSLAFGYQQEKVLACAATGCTSPDTQFTTGYVNVFAATLDARRLEVVNLGCPGETSSTLLNGTNATTGCAGVFQYPFALHVNHPGQTQLQAALDVARSSGKRLVITLDIGSNDVLALVGNTCTTAGAVDLTCVQTNAPATFATIQANLDTTLAALRSRGHHGRGEEHRWGHRKHHGHHGNGATIAVLGTFDVLYPAIYKQVLTQTGDPAAAAAAGAAADALGTQLNALQAQTAAKYGAAFADPLPVFNPQGDPAAEIASICTLTAVCGPLNDVHPTDAGYAALGNLLTESVGSD